MKSPRARNAFTTLRPSVGTVIAGEEALAPKAPPGRTKTFALLLPFHKSHPSHTSHTSHPRISAAFTIIELLVVIVIIAILILLTAAPVQNGKTRANQLVCLNNLKQISLGIHLYLEDQLNHSPGNTNAARSPFLSWTDYRPLIGDYVGVKHPPTPHDQIFSCPADRFYYALSSKDPPFVNAPLHEQTNHLFTSYAYNAGMVTTRPSTNSDGTLTPGTTNYYGIAGRRLESIAHPSRTVLIAEIPAFAPYSWHSPKKPLSQQNSKFNNSKNVLGFADGHVAYTKMYYDGKKVAWDYNPPEGYGYQWSGD